MMGSVRPPPAHVKTVAQAEEFGYRLLMIAGVLIAIGLLLTVMLFFVFVGIPLLVIGTLLAWGDFVWMLRISHQPVRELICPTCGKPNRALPEARAVHCEECGAMLESPLAADVMRPPSRG